MLAAHQVRTFRKRLLDWFRRYQRDLPWRHSKDPYRIWISEIMLQQTRVAAVIPYYHRFLVQFPDLRALASAPEDDVLRLWSGLGYYSRARNLQKAAQQVVAVHYGEFPQSEEAIRQLPGIGNYTAAAISSIAFGRKYAVLDGNVARVLARIGAVRGDIREPHQWRAFQRTAQNLLDPKSPGDWNQAMMELGATVCTPRAPQCLLCPLAAFCRARAQGDPESFPEKRKKRDAVQVVLAAAVVLDSRGQTILLPPASRKRGPDDVATLVSGMWHFPTIAVRKDPAREMETFLAKFTRLENNVFRLEPLPSVRHAVTYRNVTVRPFRVLVTKLPSASKAKKLPLADLSSLPISNLTRKITAAALAGPLRTGPPLHVFQQTFPIEADTSFANR